MPQASGGDPKLWKLASVDPGAKEEQGKGGKSEMQNILFQEVLQEKASRFRQKDNEQAKIQQWRANQF